MVQIAENNQRHKQTNNEKEDTSKCAMTTVHSIKNFCPCPTAQLCSPLHPSGAWTNPLQKQHWRQTQIRLYHLGTIFVKAKGELNFTLISSMLLANDFHLIKASTANHPVTLNKFHKSFEITLS